MRRCVDEACGVKPQPHIHSRAHESTCDGFAHEGLKPRQQPSSSSEQGNFRAEPRQAVAISTLTPPASMMASRCGTSELGAASRLVHGRASSTPGISGSLNG